MTNFVAALIAVFREPEFEYEPNDMFGEER